MAEQISIPKEEYERLLNNHQAQEKLFDVIEQLQNQVKTVQEQNERMHEQMEAVQHQMEIFSMHFGRMYASQSIEETLSAMAELGKNEIHADECAVYSVDAYNESEMFTVNQTGERTYLSPDESTLLRQSVAQHQSFVINDLSKDASIGDGTKSKNYDNLLVVPLEDKNGDVIGLAVAKNKEGGFTQDDVKAFDLKDGKVGNTFRMGLENKALQQKATTDVLTHLPNREGMNQFIKQQVLPHIKHGEDVSVMLFDIDKFKTFNDTYGHDVGDDCLKLVSETLSANLRSGDDSGVFRWGGEEIVAIVPVDEAKATEIAQRLREAVQNTPLQIEGKAPAPVTVSCGIAQFDKEQNYSVGKSNVLEAFDQTFEKADAALYFAKESGRNQVAKSSTVDQNLLVSNIYDNIVAGNIPENIWTSEKNDSTVAFSNITRTDFPEVIDMLVDRAETHRSNGFNDDYKIAKNLVANFVVDTDMGVFAELELTDINRRVEVPLTANEQECVKEAMIDFMKRKDMEIPAFFDDIASSQKTEIERGEKAMEGKPNNAKNYAELLEDMMSVMDYTIDKNANGEYQIFDQQTETYLVNEGYDTDTFKNAQEIVDRVAPTIEEYINENMHDAIEEVLAGIDPARYEGSGIQPPTELPSSAIEDMAAFIEADPILKEEMIYEGYGNDLQYLDFLAHHVDEVNMEQLFSEKWIDDVSVDGDSTEAIVYDAENGMLDIHMDVSNAIVSEMIRTSFDWGEQADDVSHGHVPDFEQAGIEYADLYVDIPESAPDKPVYTLSLQMADDSKLYFSTELSGEMKDATPMVVTDDMKSSIASVLNEHFEGKNIEEVINDFKQADKDMTD